MMLEGEMGITMKTMPWHKPDKLGLPALMLRREEMSLVTEEYPRTQADASSL